MLNKQKGNMYPWVTHTWNVIKGKCPHDCSYCYMKRHGPQPELHFDNKEIKKTDLGQGNVIFVGSSCDMWAQAIPFEWLILVGRNCYAYPKNTYLFQTKNPARFNEIEWDRSMKVILGCTIESNRFSTFSKAPPPLSRKMAMVKLMLPKMISIEPVMDFDLDDMIRWMQEIKPEFVSIGADSQGHHLPEPSGDKVKALIIGLMKFTEVKIKDNLKRILVTNGGISHE